jgi:hypothetical protein
MDRIQRHVERQLGRFDGSGSMPRIVAAWRGAVGEEVARNAWPARVARDGTLHVHTSSSVWAFELGQLTPRILEQLTSTLGEHAPASLRFAQGHLPEPVPAPAEGPPRQPPVPPSEAIAEAASLTASIDDEELRKTVAKAVALWLARRPAKLADGRPF